MTKGFFVFYQGKGVVRSPWTPGYVADSSWETACTEFGSGVSLKLENAAASTDVELRTLPASARTGACLLKAEGSLRGSVWNSCLGKDES